jgi:predicted nucleic-acid-binding protein
MIAIDTNLLVRVITMDDPDQAARAERVLRAGAYIPATVMLETAWVLTRSYRIDPAAMVDALIGVLDMPAVRMADESLIRWALARHRDAGADIADMIHLTQTGGASGFVTFDEKLARQAGPNAPVAIETPA